MTRGLFITFEGLDGSGKSTQLRLLAAALAREHRPLTVTRQPGGTAFGERVRALLLDSRAADGAPPLDPRAELSLLFADRAQTIAEVIEPALTRGELVLCDRWTDSTEAYQGGGRELPVELIHTLHASLCGGLQPDLTLLLLPSLRASLGRARSRNVRVSAATGVDENRFEREGDLFYDRVMQQYRRVAAREPVRVLAIEGDRTIEQVHALIVEQVLRRLG
jgi:dTMP kinase